MHTEFACLVGSRGDDSAGAVVPDDHRLAPKLGAAQLLDGGVERVHVEVQDAVREAARGVVSRGSTSACTPPAPIRSGSPRASGARCTAPRAEARSGAAPTGAGCPCSC